MRKNRKEKLPLMESTLTKILMKYLNVKHSVIMLTNIRQSKDHYHQEINVLEYASKNYDIKLRRVKGRKSEI